MATEEWTIEEREHEALTVAVKECYVCRKQLLESDRFCRLCGLPQPGAIASVATGGSLEVRGYSTSLIAEAEKPATQNLYHRVSGPLVDAAIAAVAGGDLRRAGRGVRKMVLALIALPIWLIIVLLSPFDAYAAARNLVRQSK